LNVFQISWKKSTIVLPSRISEKDAIFRLRYDAYLREGALTPSYSQRLSDRYDDLDNTWTFGVFVDGELASSIRIHVATPEQSDMPAKTVFGDVLDPKLESGQTLIDPTRFVANHLFARRFPELPFVTVRIGWMAGEYFKPDLILARGSDRASGLLQADLWSPSRL
jgi:hypothetical protein